MVKYYSPQVTPLDNGKFKYSIRYRDSSFKGIKKKSITITKNTTFARNQAEKAVKKKVEEQLEQYSYTPITFNELTPKLKDQWEKQGLTYKTVRSYESTLNLINQKFGDKIISNITTVQINKFFNDLLYKDNLSNSTARIYFNVISKIFDYAKQFGYVQNNIINDVKINYKDEKAKKRYRIENWYLTDDEVKIIIDYCLTKHKKVYADLFLWLYLTGMRIGEACAIQLKNIYLKQNTWYASVTGTMISVVGHSEVKQDTPKTATSRRTIALPNQAVDIYHRNSKNKTSNDFLFTNSTNHKVIVSRSAETFLLRMRPHVKIKKNVTSHIFRHTHVSKLAELGFPLSIISERIGHSSEGITRQIYLHITEQTHKTYDDKIKNLKF